jgi:hypothetical protein
MSQVRTRASWRAVGVLGAMSMLLALLALPASAEEDAHLGEILERVAQFEATSAGSDGATRAFQSSHDEESCFDDGTGDVIDFERNERSNTGREDQADIVEHCANFGPSLSLKVEVVDPRSPLEDEFWQGATAVLWAIDTGTDGQAEFFVDYSLDTEGNLRGTVVNARTDTAVCQPQAVYTGVHTVNGIRPACLGGATNIQVQAAMFYDTSTEQRDRPVLYDQAPDGDTFENAPAGGANRDAERLSGRTRYETAVAISQHEFDDADVVYLARAFDVLVDAVAGGVLTDGPILLVPQCGDIQPAVLAEINRLDPDRVLALGGDAAVCDAVLATASAGRDSGRVAGRTRYETSVAIGLRAFPNGAPEAFLARGDDNERIADAVAGGVLSSGPIFLVPKSGPLPDAVRDALQRTNPDTVYALGGAAAIEDPVLAAAGAAGRASTDRIAGPGRIDTAIAISRFEFPRTSPELYLARADIFADALAGGVLTGGPILLVPNCLPFDDLSTIQAEVLELIRSEISRVAPDTVYALGGDAAICDAWLPQAASA